MRKIFLLACMFVVFAITAIACAEEGQEGRDRDVVDRQQAHYSAVQPVPFFDFSIPRDVLTQIYKAITIGKRTTYTVALDRAGQVVHECPSIGYAIPADTQLTNPVKPAFNPSYNDGEVIDQAEPNGLFTSKNTYGTWVLCVDFDGSVVPLYFEADVNTFPYAVKKVEGRGWVRVGTDPASTRIDLNSLEGEQNP